MGVPSLVGAVLTLTGGTYLSWGSYLCLDRVSTLMRGDVTSLVISENISLWEHVVVLKEFFLEGVLGLSNVKISQVVKKMLSCQKNVRCQKVKHLDYGGGSQKK